MVLFPAHVACGVAGRVEGTMREKMQQSYHSASCGEPDLRPFANWWPGPTKIAIAFDERFGAA